MVAKKSHKIKVHCKIVFLLSLFLMLSSCGPEPKIVKKNEQYYQIEWCAGKGKVEYRLPDQTRVDCLTSTHAIEFDWANKWYESVGQSLYYSFQTNKRAGIVLIVKNKKDYKYWLRLNSTIKHFQLPIDTWVIEGF